MDKLAVSTKGLDMASKEDAFATLCARMQTLMADRPVSAVQAETVSVNDLIHRIGSMLDRRQFPFVSFNPNYSNVKL